MATILRVGKLRVMIYSNDHPPAHVHIVGPNGSARVLFVNNWPTLGTGFMGKTDWAAKQVAERFRAANERGRRAVASEPRARRVRYSVASTALHVDLNNGAAISIPVRLIPGLGAATARQLSNVEILPGGDGLHWEALDFTISVPALVAGLFGPGTWMAELGRRGGARSTAAKAAAARRNGLRGGRPRGEA